MKKQIILILFVALGLNAFSQYSVKHYQSFNENDSSLIRYSFKLDTFNNDVVMNYSFYENNILKTEIVILNKDRFVVDSMTFRAIIGKDSFLFYKSKDKSYTIINPKNKKEIVRYFPFADSSYGSDIQVRRLNENLLTAYSMKNKKFYCFDPATQEEFYFDVPDSLDIYFNSLNNVTITANSLCFFKNNNLYKINRKSDKLFNTNKYFNGQNIFSHFKFVTTGLHDITYYGSCQSQNDYFYAKIGYFDTVKNVINELKIEENNFDCFSTCFSENKNYFFGNSAKIYYHNLDNDSLVLFMDLKKLDSRFESNEFLLSNFVVYNDNIYINSNLGLFHVYPKFSSSPSFNSLKTSYNIDFSVFPNPSSSYLTVKFDEKIRASSQISLNNVNGKQLKIFSLQSGSNDLIIDTRELSPGTYFLRYTHPEGLISRKFVVVR